jgi:hypothetical protein
VDVGFDATGLTPGIYTTDLVLDHNDGPPNPYILPCALTVEECSGTTVSIDPPAVTAGLGQVFTVEVRIADVTDLGGFEFDLLYDPDVVWVLDVTLGDFLGSTGRTWFELGPTIDNINGLTTYGAGTFGALPGPDGAGVLAVVTLQAMSGGVSPLDLSAVQVMHTDSVPIEPLCVLDGQVTVTDCASAQNADFWWNDPVRTGRLTTFHGTVDGTPPFSFNWDLGDGTTAAGEVVEHTYDHAVVGVQDVLVHLDVANACGADIAEHWVDVWFLYDLDLDCDVDIVDIMSAAARWDCELGDPCYDSYYDLDLDGDVDIVDIMLVANHWGWICP